jgi:hypothetical protein
MDQVIFENITAPREISLVSLLTVIFIEFGAEVHLLDLWNSNLKCLDLYELVVSVAPKYSALIP